LGCKLFLTKPLGVGILTTAQKKGILSGIHGHGFTCQKLPKGRYQCRVSMPRGVHEGRTNPILILMNSDKNVKRNNKRPTFDVFEVDEEINRQSLEGPKKFAFYVFNPDGSGTSYPFPDGVAK
jgi:hypothetical protein